MIQKKLLSDIIIYTLFGAIEKVLPFLILPFLTRLFTIEEVGYYTLYQTVILLLVPIITCEVGTTISVNFFHYDKEKFAVSMFNGCLACLGIFAFILLLYSTFGSFVSGFINFPKRQLLIAICTIPFIFMNENLQVLYRNQDKPIAFGVFSSLRSLTSYGIGLFMIICLNYNWEAFVIGNLLSNVLFSVWALFYLVRNKFIKPNTDTYLFKENVRVGFPVSLHIIGSWLSTTVNQLLVNICIGIAATGMYGVGATFGMIMSFVQTSLNKAYIPILYKNIQNSEYKANKNMMKTLYVLVISSFAVITIGGYFGVGLLFGDTYLNTRNFILPLVLVSALQGLYKIHAAFLFYYKKTMDITKITLSLGVLNVPLAYIMLKYMGIPGAAYSSVLIWLASYILVYFASTKVYNYKK